MTLDTLLGKIDFYVDNEKTGYTLYKMPKEARKTFTEIMYNLDKDKDAPQKRRYLVKINVTPDKREHLVSAVLTPRVSLNSNELSETNIKCYTFENDSLHLAIGIQADDEYEVENETIQRISNFDYDSEFNKSKGKYYISYHMLKSSETDQYFFGINVVEGESFDPLVSANPNIMINDGKVEKTTIVSADDLKSIAFQGETNSVKLTSVKDGKSELVTIDFAGNASITLPDGTIEKVSLESNERFILFKAMKKIFVRPPVQKEKSSSYWKLTLTNESGKEFSYQGNLSPTCFDEAVDISDAMRDIFENDQLWLFDGCPDRLSGLDMKYDWTKKDDDQNITLRYHEELIIDRDSESVLHKRSFGNDNGIIEKYHIEGIVSGLLDQLSLIDLTNAAGNPSDAIFDPLETKNYELSLTFNSGETKMVFGTFDKLGLPENWPEVAGLLSQLLSYYGMGEILTKEAYNQKVRRQGDLIFCKVEFDEQGKEYSYLADEDVYSPGDWVWVPVGKDGNLKIVMVVHVDYLQPEDAPYPLDKIKHVYRKLTDSEVEEYLS